MIRSLLTITIAIAAALSSCERATRSTAPASRTPEPEPVQSAAGTVPPGPAKACAFVGPPRDESQCECLGGTARADLGNGHGACEEGEQELGAIDYGIENGVCCQPVVPLAVQPLPPGVRGRQPAVAIAAPYRGAPVPGKAPRRFRNDVHAAAMPDAAAR